MVYGDTTNRRTLVIWAMSSNPWKIFFEPREHLLALDACGGGMMYGIVACDCGIGIFHAGAKHRTRCLDAKSL